MKLTGEILSAEADKKAVEHVMQLSCGSDMEENQGIDLLWSQSIVLGVPQLYMRSCSWLQNLIVGVLKS